MWFLKFSTNWLWNMQFSAALSSGGSFASQTDDHLKFKPLQYLEPLQTLCYPSNLSKQHATMKNLFNLDSGITLKRKICLCYHFISVSTNCKCLHYLLTNHWQPKLSLQLWWAPQKFDSSCFLFSHFHLSRILKTNEQKCINMRRTCRFAVYVEKLFCTTLQSVRFWLLLGLEVDWLHWWILKSCRSERQKLL